MSIDFLRRAALGGPYNCGLVDQGDKEPKDLIEVSMHVTHYAADGKSVDSQDKISISINDSDRFKIGNPGETIRPYELRVTRLELGEKEISSASVKLSHFEREALIKLLSSI